MTTQRCKPLDAAEATPTLLAHALASLADAVFITDATGCILWVNDAFTRLSGYTPQEALGHTPGLLKSEKQDASFYRELWQTILAGKGWRGEVSERHKNGSLYTVDEVISPVRADDDTVTHFVAVLRDITQRAEQHDRDRYLAYHDILTRLPNRALFLQVLEQAILRAQRARHMLALLFLDLDRFKPINDRLGHHAGDRLLATVAERLSGAVRKTDTVARLGGDEFAILLSGSVNTDIVIALAGKLLHVVGQPFVLQGESLHTTVSIGVAFYPTDGTEPEELLRNADMAMYESKRQGRNRFSFHGGSE